MVVPIHRATSNGATFADLIEMFIARYPNPKTRWQHHRTLTRLEAFTEATHPGNLSEQQLIAWCASPLDDGKRAANNTVANRRATLAVFYKWLTREGHVTRNPAAYLTTRTSPLAKYQRTHGGVQRKNRNHWLTDDEVQQLYQHLRRIGTPLALRDELVWRLGNLGMRASEILHLTIANITPDGIEWMGKGNKPRRVKTGPAFQHAWADWLALYPNPRPDSPAICTGRRGRGRRDTTWAVLWHRPISYEKLHSIVVTRSQEAGIGFVAPHTLRRTAASRMHDARSTDGGHIFDLDEIAEVLGHSDPAVTRKCYIRPMDTETLHKASKYLD